jgi:hypothetical protein
MRKGCLFSALLLAESLAAQSPVLHQLRPLGIPAGKTTEVKMVGERLGEITDVWCSVEKVRVVATNDARLMISAPTNAAGLVALRVATTNGVSEIAMLMIDSLASLQGPATNKTPAGAQCVRSPVAIDGATDELAFDYYCFEAKKNELLAIEVMASRIGSKLDPVLRILDEQKRELAFCEDAPGAGRDPRVHFRAPATGRYLIEVRDIAYAGGPQYFYRLRVGTFPFATCTYPVAAVPGTEMTILGPADQRFKPATIRLVASAASYAAVGGSFVAVRGDDIPSQMFEREPNDAREKANAASLPHVINGRFEKHADRDNFEIEVKKDERWVFATRSRSFGSPCDIFLELQNAEGKSVAESNPAGPLDTILTHQFKEAGRYFLIVKELSDRGAPDFAYQIEARLFEPGFTLAIDEDKVEARAGGEFSLAVSCARSEFNEKIALELEGLPESFAVENGSIDAKKTNTTVKVKVPEDADPGTMLAFKVVGRGADKRVPASTAAALRRNFTTVLYPPAELDGVVMLGITAGDPAPKGRRKRP